MIGNLYHLSLSSVEGLQEQLWAVSIDILKDFLSTDIRERYGHAHQTDLSRLRKPWSVFQYFSFLYTIVLVSIVLLVMALLVQLLV